MEQKAPAENDRKTVDVFSTGAFLLHDMKCIVAALPDFQGMKCILYRSSRISFSTAVFSYVMASSWTKATVPERGANSEQRSVGR